MSVKINWASRSSYVNNTEWDRRWEDTFRGRDYSRDESRASTDINRESVIPDSECSEQRSHRDQAIASSKGIQNDDSTT